METYPIGSMVLEYLPTSRDYLENYYIGVNVGKYSSTMDPLGMVKYGVKYMVNCLVVGFNMF